MFSESPVVCSTDGAEAVKEQKVDVCEDDKRDESGQYNVCTGEVLNNRYVVVGSFGDGMYSRVLRAVDKNSEDKEVAVKVHRLNMNQSAANEKRTLETVNSSDPADRSHCIRLLDSFEDKHGTLCLVFEPMSYTLRQLLQQYRGKRAGINIAAVRVYARNLLLALKHLKTCNLVHADIKLDNALVTASYSRCKLADFGCAFSPTAAPAKSGTLCARFYRPPENMLGLPCSFPLDMWGVGCCLYELATGKFAFSGSTNHSMLWQQLQVTGKPSQKLLRHAKRASLYFDDRGFFIPEGVSDPTQAIQIAGPTRDIKSEIASLAPLVANPADKQLVHQLADLLCRIFVFDPMKRIKVEEAVQHPFVVG